MRAGVRACVYVYAIVCYVWMCLRFSLSLSLFLSLRLLSPNLAASKPELICYNNLAHPRTSPTHEQKQATAAALLELGEACRAAVEAKSKALGHFPFLLLF